jgi:hypothetical protein
VSCMATIALAPARMVVGGYRLRVQAMELECARGEAELVPCAPRSQLTATSASLFFGFPNNPNYLSSTFLSPPNSSSTFSTSFRLVEHDPQSISEENKCDRLAQIHIPLSLSQHTATVSLLRHSHTQFIVQLWYILYKAKGLTCI